MPLRGLGSACCSVLHRGVATAQTQQDQAPQDDCPETNSDQLAEAADARVGQRVTVDRFVVRRRLRPVGAHRRVVALHVEHRLHDMTNRLRQRVGRDDRPVVVPTVVAVPVARAGDVLVVRGVAPVVVTVTRLLAAAAVTLVPVTGVGRCVADGRTLGQEAGEHRDTCLVVREARDDAVGPLLARLQGLTLQDELVARGELHTGLRPPPLV